MALKLTRWSVIVSAVVFMLVSPSAIYSCGPYFEEAVFVPAAGPQVSQKNFAAGKLGIVLPTLRRSYLVVAYRYLSGLPLDNKYQQDAIDVWNRKVGADAEDINNDGTKIWSNVRSQIAGVTSVSDYGPYAPVSSEDAYQNFLNCPKDAFNAAAATLTARIEKYRADSTAVREWVAAQDQVFKNCNGKVQLIPASLDSQDALLRADRNYQIAAAQFYARKFDDAAASFDAIAKDSNSPWAAMSSYLAARALIRKANLAAADKFDAPIMKVAQQRLEQVVSDPKSTAMHAAAQRLLDYVRFRTEPAKRVAELEQIMLQPDPGPEFRQHFWDYAVLLSHGEHAADLSDWLQTVSTDWTAEHAPPPAKDTAKHALEKWREQRSLPWLVAALQLADAGYKNANELLVAANAVPATSTGYLTVRYYALRLIAGAKQDDARKELDALLTRPEKELAAGTRNLFNDERQQLGTSLADFLAHAAEVPSAIGYEEGEGGSDDKQQASQSAKRSGENAFFNAYSAKILAQHMPVSFLLQAAQSSTIQNSLRRELARSTWTRAILIGDLATADKLQPVLEGVDHPLWKTMESFRSASTESDKHFAAIFILLQNPGLSPSVREGLLRTETLGAIDSYRDNWWCDKQPEPEPKLAAPSFLSSADRTEAATEQGKLEQSVVAPNYLTSEVLTYAAQHPENPLVPQALYLSVRATHYGCSNPETTHWSEKAFQLLHARYPDSEWAGKAKYHY